MNLNSIQIDVPSYKGIINNVLIVIAYPYLKPNNLRKLTITP